MAEPKCPECGIIGTSHIDSTESEVMNRAGEPWFEIVYCDQCGHVYGVFAKTVFTHPKK